ncbi:hypothetical protein VULLAG_LOCUS15457 [Vulpes lagopus]
MLLTRLRLRLRLQLPPPASPPPLPRGVVFCSGEKCYVRKVPGGTAWGHAPWAPEPAPARSPLYEAKGLLWKMELFVFQNVSPNPSMKHDTAALC